MRSCALCSTKLVWYDYLWVKWCKQGWNWLTRLNMNVSILTKNSEKTAKHEYNYWGIYLLLSVSAYYWAQIFVFLYFSESNMQWISVIPGELRTKVEHNEFHFHHSLFGDWVVFESLEFRLVIGKYKMNRLSNHSKQQFLNRQTLPKERLSVVSC